MDKIWSIITDKYEEIQNTIMQRIVCIITSAVPTNFTTA